MLRFCCEAWRGRRHPQVYFTRRPSGSGLDGSKRVLGTRPSTPGRVRRTTLLGDALREIHLEQ